MKTKILSALAVLALATTTAGCSWFQSKETVVKDDLLNCAKADLGTTVESAGASILMTVVSILANDGTNWQADLSALEAKYGGLAISCAEKIAADLFKKAPISTPSTGALEGNDLAEQRAQSVIAGKKFAR